MSCRMGERLLGGQWVAPHHGEEPSLAPGQGMVKVPDMDVKGTESLRLGPGHGSDWGEELSFRSRTNTECWDIRATTERLRLGFYTTLSSPLA